jgi:hypothetical protein
MNDYEIDLDQLGADMYWQRSPWSRVEGHKWRQLSEQSKDGWRDQARRAFERQRHVTKREF